MVARIQLCDRRQLELALADLLLPAQSDELSQHLQGCPHCRTELEQLAGGGQWWSEAQTFLSSSEELVAVDDSHVAGTLRVPPGDHDTSGNGTRGVPTTSDDNDSPPLDFLFPSDRPGMLGRLGSYEIEDVIGRGGMGIVLKAQDPALDRRVAIKVLAGHLAASAAARKRFEFEAKAAAAVVHDHVIPIYTVEASGPTPFLVMPLVTGRSLQDRLDECGLLETREVLRIAIQTAEGLAAAHAQGLVHRDIKPANILLENGCERVRITDFGLARAVDDASQTQSGFIAGTPQYMAPEQARGEPIDSRADLFSLGSVMYAMCSGRPPFRAETTLAVLRRICDDEPRDVREINPDVPSWLAAIIAKLLAKAPADRFQSAAEVADLLKQWLAHLAQPTVILPPKAVAVMRGPRTARPQLKPWVAGVTVASTLLVVAVLGIAINAWREGGAGKTESATAPRTTGPANADRRAEPDAPAASPRGIPYPFSSRDLLADFRAAESAMASELAQAASDTAALELTAYGTSAGVPFSQALSEIELQVGALELELAPQKAALQSKASPAPAPRQPLGETQVRPNER
jgi:Protein kinase domain